MQFSFHNLKDSWMYLKNFPFTLKLFFVPRKCFLLSLHWSTFTWRMIALCRMRLALEKSRLSSVFVFISWEWSLYSFPQRAGVRWNATCEFRDRRGSSETENRSEINSQKEKSEFSDDFFFTSVLGKNYSQIRESWCRVEGVVKNVFVQRRAFLANVQNISLTCDHQLFPNLLLTFSLNPWHSLWPQSHNNRNSIVFLNEITVMRQCV